LRARQIEMPFEIVVKLITMIEQFLREPPKNASENVV
jgi:hypothetical protein